jgi:hypothetical protein
MSNHRSNVKGDYANNITKLMPANPVTLGAGGITRSCSACAKHFPHTMLFYSSHAIYKCVCYQCFVDKKLVPTHKSIARLKEIGHDVTHWVRKDQKSVINSIGTRSNLNWARKAPTTKQEESKS